MVVANYTLISRNKNFFLKKDLWSILAPLGGWWSTLQLQIWCNYFGNKLLFAKMKNKNNGMLASWKKTPFWKIWPGGGGVIDVEKAEMATAMLPPTVARIVTLALRVLTAIILFVSFIMLVTNSMETTDYRDSSKKKTARFYDRTGFQYVYMHIFVINF